MYKAVWLTLVSLSLGVAGEGKALFDTHCVSCHSHYIPMRQVIANAASNNSLLQLKAPTLTELSYGLYLNVGDRKADEESQRMEVESYIADYLEGPDRNQSVLPAKHTHFYPDMPAMKGVLEEEEIEVLSAYIYEYGEAMIKAHSAKTYSFEEAKKIAKENGKIILIRGVLPYCKWCIKMDREVMVEAEVKQMMEQHFVTVKMDVILDTLPLGMKSLGTPSFYFIQSNGETIIDMLQGFGNKEEFLSLLEMIRQKARK
ncbi:MAG TPA: DUF255 domain-containing protein [Epsilonproteobacteria bacterium]|nr:DUF255 domain-containing protein [Campylobacterota bacterium]